MIMTLQPESENQLSIVFHGSTWLFRDTWDSYDVRAVTYEQEGTTQYCRVMEKLDVSAEGGQDKLFNVLDGALKNLAVRVIVEGGGAVSGPVRSFVQSLRAREELFFA